ncbi:MAG: nucleotidyltransferase [Victivallales bacterium]|nr:nucleotidyltransferase [Victivallales bacterium]
MIQIPRDFLDFIRLLNAQGAEYLIVGGYAVATYGYVRYTGDIDFFIAMNPENARKMVQVFQKFGFNTAELDENLFLEPGKIIRIGVEPMRLEVMNQIDGVGFTECFERRTVLNVNGVQINFIGLEQLICNKKATGRGKDKVDAEELEKRLN